MIPLAWALVVANALMLFVACVKVYNERFLRGERSTSGMRLAVSLAIVFVTNIFGAALLWAVPNFIYDVLAR